MVSESLENNTNKLIEKALGIQNVSFVEDLEKNKEFDEYFVKRSGSFYKKTKNKRKIYYINMIFKKNNKKYGIKIKPEEFVKNEEFDYIADDFIDGEDGRVLYIGKKPIRLPFQFYGTKTVKDLEKLISYLEEKINQRN